MPVRRISRTRASGSVFRKKQEMLPGRAAVLGSALPAQDAKRRISRICFAAKRGTCTAHFDAEPSCRYADGCFRGGFSASGSLAAFFRMAGRETGGRVSVCTRRASAAFLRMAGREIGGGNRVPASLAAHCPGRLRRFFSRLSYLPQIRPGGMLFALRNASVPCLRGAGCGESVRSPVRRAGTDARSDARSFQRRPVCRADRI
mgnify:CR=1 FL=1